MQISDLFSRLNVSGNAKPGLSEAGVINGAKEAYRTSESAAINLNTSAYLDTLEEGALFEGTISSIKGNSVLLNLQNGQVIEARLDKNVSLLEGMKTYFQVKSNNKGQIFIKPVTQADKANSTVLRALSQAGFEFSDKNIAIVKSMMDYNMPIDSNNIARVIKDSTLFKTALPESIVRLHAMHLPVTEANVEQMEHYYNSEGQIHHDLSSALDEVVKAFQNDFATNAKPLELCAEIVNLLEDIPNESPLEINEETPVKENENVNQKTQETSNKDNEEQLLKDSIDIKVDSKEEILKTRENDVIIDKETQNVSKKLDGNNQISRPETRENEVVFNEPEENHIPEKISIKEYIKDAISKQTNNSERPVDGKVLEQLTRALGKEYENKTEVLKELYSFIKEENIPENDKKAFFSGREFTNVLKEALNEQWFIKPDEVKEEKELNKLYQRIERQMQKIESLFNKKGAEKALNSMENVRNNIQFQNQINELYQFVQIPLKMTNQNASGELYVYSRKKKLSANDGELTAHLHLDMEHLGTTDVFIKLVNKFVTTNFVLEDEKSLDLIIQNIDILTERLKKCGFETSYTVKDAKTVSEERKAGRIEDNQDKDFVREILELEGQCRFSGNFNFDVKV